ncbi:hypothetical protein C8T65DRAFT_693591 [Cerioporus squamosus]|nr:hypothetical protein C8T65DRAFT_693591 [Cerioporus squamosus]
MPAHGSYTFQLLSADLVTITLMARTHLRRATIERLPVELRTMVLKFLGPDKRSLSSCSMLSSDWRSLALPFLFAYIKAKSNTTFSDLFAFLVDHPSLAKLVKTISFHRSIQRTRYSVPGAGLDLVMFHDDRPSFDCAAFTAVLPHLTALQKLAFEDIKVRKRVPSEWQVGNPVAPFVLHQLDLNCNSTLPLLPILLSVFSVKTVQFGRIVLQDGVLPVALLEHLGTVVIPNLVIARHATALLGPLRNVIHHGRLRSLTVAIDAVKQYDSLCSFIREAAPALTALDLDLSHLVHEATKRWHVDYRPLVRWANLGEALPTCQALETLRIVVPVKRPSEICTTFDRAEDDPRSSLFSGITAHLPRTLREVTVCLACDGFSDSMKPFFTNGTKPELWDLATLDTALSPETLVELQVVKVVVQLSDAMGRRMDIPCLQKAIIEALPELSAGALLRVVSHG